MTEEELQPEGQNLQQGVRNQTDIEIIMCMRRAVMQTFSTMCHIDLKEKPKIKLKPVVRWQGKIRVIKPVDCSFCSVITFGHQRENKKKYEVDGIIVLYIPDSTSEVLLPAMGLRGNFDEDDIKDACGEFLNVMAGGFKAELVKNGYEEIEISTPFNFGLKVDELFDYYEDYEFEISFFREQKRFLQVDIGLDKITK